MSLPSCARCGHDDCLAMDVGSGWSCRSCSGVSDDELERRRCARCRRMRAAGEGVDDACARCLPPAPIEVAPKFDDGKAPLHLLAPDFLVAVAEVLAFGARKYVAWSWTRGKPWSKDYGAALRHLVAWWGGEDRDPESNLSHLAHAATDLMFLLVSQARGLGEDDRWRPPARVAEPPRAGESAASAAVPSPDAFRVAVERLLAVAMAGAEGSTPKLGVVGLYDHGRRDAYAHMVVQVKAILRST